MTKCGQHAKDKNKVIWMIEIKNLFSLNTLKIFLAFMICNTFDSVYFFS